MPGSSPAPPREPSPASAPAGVSPRFWALLRAEPLAGRDVLDVGTGSGRLALALAPFCRHVVGLDRDVAALAEARRRAEAAGLANVEFVEHDADAERGYRDLPGLDRLALVVAHLCVSDRIIDSAARALSAGGALALVAFHADQWRETGRPSRFAYDEERLGARLTAAGLAVEHLEVERDVQRFASVEEALAAAIGLEERWRSDGRWFRYIKFLEEGGRTLTRAHVLATARRR
ncbi:MAG TPA: methyltransferase domain-containing protein [Methylomirabilota bacterium]|nr:methyltransferase domain-containing protein [Methylomirabilota bacterium]